MAFGKRTLTPNLLTKMIKVSRKLLRVSGIDVDALVRDQLSYKIAVAQEKAYLTGGGSGEPLGLFTASANGVTTARDVATGSTTSITADGLIAAKYALKDGYLADPSCVWLLSRTALAIIRKLKDATSGQYLWVPGLQQDRPDTVLGIPVACSEYVPTTFSSNAYVGVIGALRYYLIADSLNVEIQVVDQTYAATNQIGYIVRYEGDGIPAIAEAFARMKCAS